MTFVEYQALLLAEGYREGRPPRFGLHDDPDAQAAACAVARCGRCGRVGLACRPFYRAEPALTVGVAVCNRCSWATEP